MILGALGLLGTAWAICKGGSLYEEEAHRGLNRKDFDNNLARYGLMHDINDKKIRMFAARHGVRYQDHRFKILPELYKGRDLHIDDYISQYAISYEDANDFYKAWNEYNDRMIEEKNEILRQEGEIIYKCHEKEYRWAQDCSVNCKYDKEFTIQFSHWRGITHKECVNRMYRIINETFMKEIIVEAPRLRSSMYGGWHETWTIRAPSEKIAKEDYKGCCKKFGWDPEI